MSAPEDEREDLHGECAHEIDGLRSDVASALDLAERYGQERDEARLALNAAEAQGQQAAQAMADYRVERDALRADLLEAVTLLGALWRAVPGSETPDLVARVERALGAR